MVEKAKLEKFGPGRYIDRKTRKRYVFSPNGEIRELKWWPGQFETEESISILNKDGEGVISKKMRTTIDFDSILDTFKRQCEAAVHPELKQFIVAPLHLTISTIISKEEALKEDPDNEKIKNLDPKKVVRRVVRYTNNNGEVIEGKHRFAIHKQGKFKKKIIVWREPYIKGALSDVGTTKMLKKDLTFDYLIPHLSKNEKKELAEASDRLLEEHKKMRKKLTNFFGKNDMHNTNTIVFRDKNGELKLKGTDIFFSGKDEYSTNTNN